MLRTAVDDGVVDLGRFSCFSYLAARQQPAEPSGSDARSSFVAPHVATWVATLFFNFNGFPL